MNENFDDFDELDRALFALPLETPPAGLRAAILRATIYRDAPAPTALGPWEIRAIGVALAFAAWLVISSLVDKTLGTTLTLAARLLLRELSDPATLAWLAAGASIASLMVFANFTVPRRPLRNGRT